jgi:hypothetical protein
MFPDNNTIIYGAILMVNNKPQGFMRYPPCTQFNNTYYVPPTFIKIGYFRDDIITAAGGNVDNQ